MTENPIISCEFCLAEHGITQFSFGGWRNPEKKNRPSSCALCPACKAVAVCLYDKLHWREGDDDTTNSRFQKIKAMVKRIRFGHANYNATTRQVTKQGPWKRRRKVQPSPFLYKTHRKNTP